MPPSRKAQKKDRFVADLVLAHTFLICAHLLNPVLPPFRKGAVVFFFFFSHLLNFDAFTAGNVLLRRNLLLLTAAMLPRLMPFSPNASKRLRLSVLKLMTLSRELHGLSFVNMLTVFLAPKKAQLMKLLTPRVKLLMSGLLASVCMSISLACLQYSC